MGNWLRNKKEFFGIYRLFAFVGVMLMLAGFLTIVSNKFYPPSQPVSEPPTYSMVIVPAADERPVLMLDAGHGGEDPGALDASLTIKEAEINQQIVNRLLLLLEPHNQDIKVLQSHEPGVAATTEERAEKAKENKADLFVSLHLNSDWNTNFRGFQCFAVPPARQYHDESVRFSEIIVDKMRDTPAQIMGTGGIYYTFYKEISPGEYVKEIYDAGWFDHTQPREDETFGVLENAGCPAVLVEQWYISNAVDMSVFYTEEGMDIMAEKLYLSICTYFTMQPKG